MNTATPDIPDSELASRCHAVIQRILEGLQVRRTAEETVRDLALVMRELIPFDRFVVVSYQLNRAFVFDDGVVSTVPIPSDEPMSPEASSGRAAILSGSPIVRRDINEEACFEHDTELLRLGVVSELVVPLTIAGDLNAVVSYRSRTEGVYTDVHKAYALEVRSAIALAVRDIHVRGYVDSVQSITAVLEHGNRGLDTLIQRVLSEIQSQGFERARLYLYDERAEELVGACQVGGVEVRPFKGARLPLREDPYTQKTMSVRTAQIYQFGQFEADRWPRLGALLDDVAHREKGDLPLFVVEEGRNLFVGKISVDNGRSGIPLRQDALDRLMVFASHAALAIRNAQLLDNLESEVAERTSDLEVAERRESALVRLGRAVLEMRRPGDLVRVLERCIEEVRELGMNVEAIALHRMIDAETKTLHTVRVASGLDPITEQRGGRSLLTRLWETQQPSVCADVSEDGELAETTIRGKFGGRPIMSYVDVPFSTGVISAHSLKVHAYGERDILILKQIAESVALGISRAEDLASVDENEKRLRLMADASFEGIAITENGIVLDCNRQLAELMGYGGQEILGKPISDLVTKGSSAIAMKHIREDYLEPYELTAVRKDGSEFPIEVQGRTISLGGRQARITAVRDLTDRKQAELELVRLERLGALGEIAQGVAHNFNNMLVGVLGYAQLIEMESDDETTRGYAGQVVKSAERARDLVQRLSLSVRGRREDSAKVDVNAAIREAVDLTRPKWQDEAAASGVQIEVVFELEDVPLVRGSQSRLSDALTNMIFNAVEAMPNGGRVMIRSELEGDRVLLSIADTGVGMDADTRLRAFEPFFTTKLNVGTGLGLSTVRATVTSWGGTVQLQSAPGRGTRFTLKLLPWREENDAFGRQASMRSDREVSLNGRILVVDDDTEVVDFLVRMLGVVHSVDTAESGTRALTLLNQGEYDVAMIDLGMPGMPGDELAEELRRKDPCIATVLITGWHLAPDDPRLSDFDFHLEKPFVELRKIHEIIQRGITLRRGRASERGNDQLSMDLSKGRDGFSSDENAE